MAGIKTDTNRESFIVEILRERFVNARVFCVLLGVLQVGVRVLEDIIINYVGRRSFRSVRVGIRINPFPPGCAFGAPFTVFY